MCRLLGYLGPRVQLHQLLYQPQHSLIVQSYQPREMTAGLLNADGFGLGWYHPDKHEEPPYIYKNTVPIWTDINLPHLSRYVDSPCLLGYVRSATPPLAVDFSNCQPFSYRQILFVHNGFIHNFRTSLYRPIRDSLSDEIYQLIQGSTDSEHIFALVMQQLYQSPELDLASALTQALKYLTQLAHNYQVYFSANIILSDGHQIVASRYANRSPVPSLYWLQDNLNYPEALIIVSEPIFEGKWQSCPENTIITRGKTFEVEFSSVS
ncbi:ergothioneine biosynthesis protein EgtC [Gloeocapsa sp. PCC 73106]|uniref:ergothioneine biosynthesis protein EgtC n=1 Tax=Gloeocapsa sp. PCC 73106 TaxID=102232 RepID=UPI0002ACEA9D|nr:ergothioneine biosynthesis protein EgtC [Gloeocapsa sp. PCC 73106]ELR99140.1 TIGR03442 family protein [Gloeocapsa sp. PCC 73106]